MAKPFVKWVGGKGQLLPQLLPMVPETFGGYYEPFVGGGAMFFGLSATGKIDPQWTVLSDMNAELVSTYHVVRDVPNLLVEALHLHTNEANHFYHVRAQAPTTLNPVKRAARFVYLNKTCFNGLYRVNKAGQFNVPFGRYTNPCICDEKNIFTVSAALQGVVVGRVPFEVVVDQACRGDFIYFDPPYHPVSATANFTSYTGTGFGMQEQRLLAGVFYALDKRGCHVMLSNSDTPFIRELYDGYRIVTVQATRRVNSKADGRGAITEVVVLNY